MKITVAHQTKTSSGWKFEVKLDNSAYNVTLKADYYQKLTGGRIEPADLVRLSFDFLLERETKDQILPQFDLEQIQTYFEEYEDEIRV